MKTEKYKHQVWRALSDFIVIIVGFRGKIVLFSMEF